MIKVDQLFFYHIGEFESCQFVFFNSQVEMDHVGHRMEESCSKGLLTSLRSKKWMRESLMMQ